MFDYVEWRMLEGGVYIWKNCSPTRAPSLRHIATERRKYSCTLMAPLRPVGSIRGGGANIIPWPKVHSQLEVMYMGWVSDGLGLYHGEMVQCHRTGIYSSSSPSGRSFDGPLRWRLLGLKGPGNQSLGRLDRALHIALVELEETLDGRGRRVPFRHVRVLPVAAK